MIIIGEKINTSIKSVRKIVETRDVAALKELAILQSESGANYLDVNVSTEKEESFDKESMEWAIDVIQEAVSTPLTLDSPDPGLIEVGLRKCQGQVMINSVTAESEKLEPEGNRRKRQFAPAELTQRRDLVEDAIERQLGGPEHGHGNPPRQLSDLEFVGIPDPASPERSEQAGGGHHQG